MHLLYIMFQALILVSQLQTVLDTPADFILSDRDFAITFPGKDISVPEKKSGTGENFLYRKGSVYLLSLGTESFLHKGRIVFINSDYFYCRLPQQYTVHSKRWRLRLRENSQFHFQQSPSYDVIRFFSGSGIHQLKKRTRFLNDRSEYRFNQR